MSLLCLNQEKGKTIKTAGQGGSKGECKMLRLKNIGGERVGKGNYWNFSTGERVHMEASGVLDGDASQTYYRLSPAAILVAGPIIGLAYAAFLPFIGIAMLADLLLKKAFGGIVQNAWKGAAFSWQPSESYLSGKKGKARKAEAKEEAKKDEVKKE